MSFGKIFESTFTGSMVGSGPTVFSVWSYVIANTRPPGVVEINPVILAAILGTTTEDINAALAVLTSPDANSRTKLEDGRRLVKVAEYSYDVPTWQKYRNARNDEERKAYNREAQRKHRSSIRASMTCQESKPLSAQAEAEAEAKPPLPKAQAEPAGFEDFWRAYPKKQAKGQARKAWINRKCSTLLPQILAAVEKAKASEQWRKDGGQFIPYPASWLNAERWEDEIAPPPDRMFTPRKPESMFAFKP